VIHIAGNTGLLVLLFDFFGSLVVDQSVGMLPLNSIDCCCGDSLLWFMLPVLVVPDFVLVLLTLVPAVGSRYSCLLYFGIPRTPMFSFCDARLHLFNLLRSGNAMSRPSTVAGLFLFSLSCQPWHSCSLRIFVGSLLRIVVPHLRILLLLRWDSSPIYRLHRSLHWCLPVYCHLCYLYLLLRLALPPL
jgi:hypothetical protein